MIEPQHLLDLKSRFEKTLDFSGVKSFHSFSCDYSQEIRKKLIGHDLDKYNVYPDGSYSRKLGRGGYGLVMFKRCGDKVFTSLYSQGFFKNKELTVNRMELSSILRALSLVKKSSDFHIYSDSKYCVNSIGSWEGGIYSDQQGWCINWAANKWKTFDGNEVKNKDLISGIMERVKFHKSVKLSWVKGHSLSFFNNVADELATLATRLGK